MSLEHHFAGPRISSAAFGPVVFNYYLDTPTATDLDRFADVQRALAASGGRPVGVLSVVPPGLGMPDATVRRHGSALNRELDGVVAVSATVIEGAGFWMSTALSLVNTILLVGNAERPNRIFRDLGEGMGWIVEHLGGVDLEPVALVETFERWRAGAAIPEHR